MGGKCNGSFFGPKNGESVAVTLNESKAIVLEQFWCLYYFSRGVGCCWSEENKILKKVL